MPLKEVLYGVHVFKGVVNRGPPNGVALGSPDSGGLPKASGRVSLLLEALLFSSSTYDSKYMGRNACPVYCAES
jgi:hypothetical protein